MKKAVCTSALAVLLMAGAIGSALPASAAVPYVSYNYDFYGNVVESPDIYQPDQIISGSALGVGVLFPHRIFMLMAPPCTYLMPATAVS